MRQPVLERTCRCVCKSSNVHVTWKRIIILSSIGAHAGRSQPWTTLYLSVRIGWKQARRPERRRQGGGQGSMGDPDGTSVRSRRYLATAHGGQRDGRAANRRGRMHNALLLIWTSLDWSDRWIDGYRATSEARLCQTAKRGTRRRGGSRLPTLGTL